MKSSEPKRKWYSVRPRILDLSRRQLGTISLCSMGMLALFFALSFTMPPEHRSHFRSSSMSGLIGMTLAVGGAWLYKRWKPDSPQYKGLTGKTFIQQGAAGIIIIGTILGTWRLLYVVGYPNHKIAVLMGIFGGAILFLAVLVIIFFQFRNANHIHTNSTNDGED